eukprot:TRINITY_DN19437_c0_g2_i1.p1 TRINITY_DN19437_c0_g2~~TRINITY_DN19437_c0_g2_i1.p1  ORF type:complete len:885 (+),score=165.70 TRINITY_DN19437_c0_g2_i1:234-2657(+)
MKFGHIGDKYQETYIKKVETLNTEEFTESSRKLAEHLQQTNINPETDNSQWMDLEGKVLRFFGYWREPAVEPCHDAKPEIRKVIVSVFPHDETVRVVEPRAPNSGLQGGVLVSRHRIPASAESKQKRSQLAGSDDNVINSQPDDHLNPNDFVVGDDVLIYGKRITLVDCDGFTRELLSAVGCPAADPIPFPDNSYACDLADSLHVTSKSNRTATNYADYDLRKTHEHSAKGRIVSHYPSDIQRVQKFLAGDSQVCRYWAIWNDTDNPHGEMRRFEIRYYLQDGTAEILENLQPNSGREPCRSFCARRRLPKPGMATGADLTFSSRANGFRYDAPAGVKESDCYYDDMDLRIGETITIFGRKLDIYSCDRWTRDYYTQQGIDVPDDIDVSHLSRVPTPPSLRPPKHNGFGTEADSIGNCKSLVLRAPKQDTVKWHKHAETLLRFKCKLHSPSEANDSLRRFIITFYVADDTMMVNEISVRNTGYLAGRFLKRQRIRKATTPEGDSVYYAHEDLYPDVVLDIFKHKFEIISMDDFTKKFKESQEGSSSQEVQEEVCPQRTAALAAQLRGVISAKHVTLTDAFRHYDHDRDGFLPLDEFKEMLLSLHIKVSHSEAVALLTHLDADEDGRLNLSDFAVAITGSTVKSFLDGEGAEFGTVKKMNVDDAAKYVRLAAQRPQEVLRQKVLRTFREKVEARQMNLFEMFRLLSTMPSSFKDPRKGNDVSALGSGGSDSLLGPVQLRRGVQERFNFGFSETEMDHLMQFFFPTLPKELYSAPREQTAEYRLSLSAFQTKWGELEAIGQLAPDKSLK